MPIPIRFALFFLGCLLLNYILYSPDLVDAYHLIRFAGWSILALLGVGFLLFPLKKWSLNCLEGILLAFWAWSSISLLWSENFGEAIFTNQKYLLLAITVIIFRQGLSQWKKHPLGLSILVDLALLLTLVVASVQLLRLGDLDGKVIYQVFGHAGHKNLVASFIMLLVGFQLFLGFYDRRRPWFWPLLTWAVVLLVILRSRGVFMGGLAGGLLFLGVLSVAKLPDLSLIRRRIVWGVLGFGVCLGGFLTFTDTGQNYQKFFNPLSYTGSASATERLFVWYKSWDLATDRPWHGFGTGNWKLFFPSKNIEGGFRLQEKDLIFTRAHNDFLEIFTELGLPGILLYLAGFVVTFLFLYRAWKLAKNTTRKLAVLMLSATLLAYIVVAFFDFPKERMEHQTYLALLFAFAAYLAYPDRLAKGWRVPWPGVAALLLGIGLLVNLPISYYRYQGDAASRIILGLRDQGGQYGAIIDKQAAQAYSRWYTVDPMVIPLPWYRGVFNYANNDFSTAESLFAEAYALNPYNFNVINNYGSTLVRQGKFTEAIPLYQQALQINPRFEEGMFNLSFSYFQLGEYEKALEWAQKPVNSPEKQAEFFQNIRSKMEE